MRYPFLSFAVGLMLYFLGLAALVFFAFRTEQNSQISLTIDTELVGKTMQHEKSQVKKLLKEKNLEEVAMQKRKEKKSDEEKVEPNEANANKEEHNSDKKQRAQKLEPAYHPLPAIPDELRFEAFNSYAIARFYISASGVVEKVELIKPCSNPKLNQLLLKTLKNWTFNSSHAPSTRDIRVTFKVE